MRFAYPVELVAVEEGPPEDHCVLLTFPDLPEANTFGKTEADALASVVRDSAAFGLNGLLMAAAKRAESRLPSRMRVSRSKRIESVGMAATLMAF